MVLVVLVGDINGVSINGGTLKCMFHTGKSKSKMDHLGVPPFLETPI
jgi:hypothetical protein